MKIIVDVREPEEFEAFSVPGSINLPLSKISFLSEEFFDSHQDTHFIIMCRAGIRAQKAYNYWVNQGLVKESSLEVYPGGLLNWK